MQKHSYSKKVSIVTVTHNSAAVIEKCLRSIPNGIRVFLVDNQSSDDTCKIAEAARPDTVLIKSPENLGFGRANNLALEKVTSEFALLLNPDTVLQEDSIEKLLESAGKYPEAAIISPTLYHEDGSLQQSYKTNVFRREKIRAKYIEPDGDLCAEFLSGAVMLLRMECFRKTGFFDPHIFLFYEDDDLCMQARKHGFSLILAPEARMVHLMGKSTPPTTHYTYLKNWHLMWSRLYLEKKYKGGTQSRILAVKSLYIYAFKTMAYAAMLKNEKAVRSMAKTAAAMAFLVGKRAV